MHTEWWVACRHMLSMVTAQGMLVHHATWHTTAVGVVDVALASVIRQLWAVVSSLSICSDCEFPSGAALALLWRCCLLQPEREGCYTLADVRRTRPQSSLLFNTMFNLHKFMAFENRDPFALRAEQLGEEGQVGRGRGAGTEAELGTGSLSCCLLVRGGVCSEGGGPQGVPASLVSCFCLCAAQASWVRTLHEMRLTRGIRDNRRAAHVHCWR